MTPLDDAVPGLLGGNSDSACLTWLWGTDRSPRCQCTKRALAQQALVQKVQWLCQPREVTCALKMVFKYAIQHGCPRPWSLQAAAIFHTNVFSVCLLFFLPVKLTRRETTLRQGLNCSDSSLSHLEGALLEQWL